MIESAFRIPKNVPRPRPTQLVTPAEKGYSHETPPCKVWSDAQTLGIELSWTTEYTLTVVNEGGKVAFDCDKLPSDPVPLEPLGEHYYAIHTGQHILLARGLGGLVLPHPRFFDPVPDGCYNDAPAVVPGLLQMDWWPRGLYIVCSMPKPGAEQVFHAGEPFCQIVPVPISDITIRPMDAEETAVWDVREKFIGRLTSDGEHYESLAKQIRKIGWQGLSEKYPEASK